MAFEPIPGIDTLAQLILELEAEIDLAVPESQREAISATDMINILRRYFNQAYIMKSDGRLTKAEWDFVCSDCRGILFDAKMVYHSKQDLISKQIVQTFEDDMETFFKRL